MFYYFPNSQLYQSNPCPKLILKCLQLKLGASKVMTDIQAMKTFVTTSIDMSTTCGDGTGVMMYYMTSVDTDEGISVMTYDSTSVDTSTTCGEGTVVMTFV